MKSEIRAGMPARRRVKGDPFIFDKHIVELVMQITNAIVSET